MFGDGPQSWNKIQPFRKFSTNLKSTHYTAFQATCYANQLILTTTYIRQTYMYGFSTVWKGSQMCYVCSRNTSNPHILIAINRSPHLVDPPSEQRCRDVERSLWTSTPVAPNIDFIDKQHSLTPALRQCTRTRTVHTYSIYIYLYYINVQTDEKLCQFPESHKT